MRAVLALGGRGKQRLRQPRPSCSPRAAECRRPSPWPRIPSSPNRPGSRAPHIPPETSAPASPASSGLPTGPHRAAARQGTRDLGGDQMIGNQILDSRSNQNSEICVRILPLPGIPVASTWSKAEMRSVATSSKCVVHGIEIAHFAAAKQRSCAQICCQQSCHGRASSGGTESPIVERERVCQSPCRCAKMPTAIWSGAADEQRRFAAMPQIPNFRT